MSRRRGATGLRGILVIDKPTGPTSHDVVAALRRATGEQRIGHAGTLDPLASGVLVTLIGSFARLDRYLATGDKEYEATIAFGVETDTDDAEGAPTRTVPAPARVLDPVWAAERLTAMRGASSQVPPAYSAIKVQGRVAHRLARAGETVELPARPIVVHAAELLGIDADAPAWRVRFRVSKGTYIRSLARDLGRALGSAAHLTALRRTVAGTLSLHDAVTLPRAEAAAREGGLATLLADAPHALGLPIVPLSADEARLVGQGRPLSDPLPAEAGERASLVADGALLAVYRRQHGLLIPETVLVSAA